MNQEKKIKTSRKENGEIKRAKRKMEK